jgi:hypothetical protein
VLGRAFHRERDVGKHDRRRPVIRDADAEAAAPWPASRHPGDNSEGGIKLDDPGLVQGAARGESRHAVPPGLRTPARRKPGRTWRPLASRRPRRRPRRATLEHGRPPRDCIPRIARAEEYSGSRRASQPTSRCFPTARFGGYRRGIEGQSGADSAAPSFVSREERVMAVDPDRPGPGSWRPRAPAGCQVMGNAVASARGRRR